MNNKPNKLVAESSLYLRQHAFNPVNWHPWGDEALTKAKIENKLLLLSIGYSACHWCHVMEHESFSDEEVAAFMNQHFVCVKIDREERPDLDQLYMESVQLLHGHGGWPLNCFALPDGRPFWGGTYFTKSQWLGVLDQIASLYSSEPATIVDQAERISEGITQMNLKVSIPDDDVLKKLDLTGIFSSLSAGFDNESGGMRGAPKFPMPSVYRFLLHFGTVYQEHRALDHVLLTLRQMAAGGIHDQAGGGFARYSTDKLWKVPHFEKMLYDNAQLITLYCEAYLVCGDQNLLEVAFETMSFLERDMGNPSTGFKAAVDADSPEGEGAFYTFTQEELNELLGPDAPLFSVYFKTGTDGLWEDGKNILLAPFNLEQFCTEHKIDPDDFKIRLKQVRKVLLNHRSQRPAPAVDTKIITSWNAMVLIAYLDLYRASGISAYLTAAEMLATFISSKLLQNKTDLLHHLDEQKQVPGFLDDYSFTIHALIRLYGSNLNEKWVVLAANLADSAIEQFYDEVSGLFYFTSSKHGKAFARRQEIHDNVIPSSNSIMMECLMALGHIFGNEKYAQISRQAIWGMSENILKHPSAFSNWARILLMQNNPYYTITITGEKAHDLLPAFLNKYLPHSLLTGSDRQSNLPILLKRFKNGETMIYVCVEKECHPPINDAESALKIISKQMLKPE